MATIERIGILRFEDRNRFGQHGIPTTLLFGGGARVITNCKTATKLNHWAKLRVPPELAERDASGGGAGGGEAAAGGGQAVSAELVELLGPVGDYATELYAYQLHFGVLPCRYPPEAAWALAPADAEQRGETSAAGAVGAALSPPPRADATRLEVFSVDNAGTRDIDDALSFEWAADGSSCTVGVHVADVASRVPCGSALFAWAAERGASARPRRR